MKQASCAIIRSDRDPQEHPPLDRHLLRWYLNTILQERNNGRLPRAASIRHDCYLVQRLALSSSCDNKARVKFAKVAQVFHNAAVFNTLQINVYELINRSTMEKT